MSVTGRVLLGALVVLGLVLIAPFVLLASGAFRLMYMPAESMMPTFDVGDKFVVRMSPPAPLARGDIVIVDAPGGSLYVKRVAALPGDRIAVRDGIVLLNGRPVPQRLVGEDRVAPDVYGDRVRRLAEQFPGEPAPHEIYDAGDSPGDHFDEQQVSPGHIFLLGDNRDHSADSRFSHEDQGLEQVPLADIRGAPLFFYWTVGRHRIGDGAGH
jgi:signal peptidase I